jgi:hypothetical protein
MAAADTTFPTVSDRTMFTLRQESGRDAFGRLGRTPQMAARTVDDQPARSIVRPLCSVGFASRCSRPQRAGLV